MLNYLGNQSDSTCTLKFLTLIVLFSIKRLELANLKAQCYGSFISLEFCELIREKGDKFLSFIMHAFFYSVILIYFLLVDVFSRSLKVFSYIFSYIYAFCNDKILAFLLFLTFLFPIFNNGPYGVYINNCCIV